MKTTLPLLAAVWGVVMAGQGHAQTAIDLRTQSKSVDFSGAQLTKPVKTGTSLPATCQVGELFFRTDITTGKNLYGCVSANTWRQTAADVALTDLTGVTGKTGNGSLVQMSGGGSLNANDCAKFDASGNVISAGAPCGSGSGGGSTPALTAIAFSATPAFPITNSTQGFTLTLTGPVTGSTFSGSPASGQEVWFRICEDSNGGWSFVYPSSVTGNDTIDTAPNACTSQLFKYVSTSSTYAAVTAGKSDNMVPGVVTPSGALNLPLGPDTLVGRASTDTMSNKTLVAPALGTPASGVMSNVTGLPLTTGVTGTLGAANGGTGRSSYTKGDLLCATGSTTLTNLSVGSNTNVLTADSTQPCGVKWAAGGGSGGSQTAPSATAWYEWPFGFPLLNGSGFANLATNAEVDLWSYTPAYPMTLGHVTAFAKAASASQHFIVGLYDTSGNKLWETAVYSESSSNAAISQAPTTGSVSLTQGTTYYIGVSTSDATGGLGSVNLGDGYLMLQLTPGGAAAEAVYCNGQTANFSNAAGSILPVSCTLTYKSSQVLPALKFSK